MIHCLIPDCPAARRGNQHLKYTTLSLLHDRLGHRGLRSLLAAEEHQVWADTKIRIESDTDCTTCKIATICAVTRNKYPHTPAGHPGHTVSWILFH
jgi:hypothetical protein